VLFRSLYGLGDLPQAFARLSAVFGGTFMLDTPFKGVRTDDDGELCGINSTVNGKECVLKCKSIFASPDYFPDKVEKKGDIARCYWCATHTLSRYIDLRERPARACSPRLLSLWSWDVFFSDRLHAWLVALTSTVARGSYSMAEGFLPKKHGEDGGLTRIEAVLAGRVQVRVHTSTK
jgi:hypothetical protein